MVLSDKDKALAMRAAEEDYDDYAERYQERANEPDSGMNGDADWDRFEELWDDRNSSNEAMAELLAEVMGVAYDEALAWIEGEY